MRARAHTYAHCSLAQPKIITPSPLSPSLCLPPFLSVRLLLSLSLPSSSNFLSLYLFSSLLTRGVAFLVHIHSLFFFFSVTHKQTQKNTHSAELWTPKEKRNCKMPSRFKKSRSPSPFESMFVQKIVGFTPANCLWCCVMSSATHRNSLHDSATHCKTLLCYSIV